MVMMLHKISEGRFMKRPYKGKCVRHGMWLSGVRPIAWEIGATSGCYADLHLYNPRNCPTY